MDVNALECKRIEFKNYYLEQNFERHALRTHRSLISTN
jgi:hypothetical protein